MITEILVSESPHIKINPGISMLRPYLMASTSMSTVPDTGNLRVNLGNIEAWDGSYWAPLTRDVLLSTTLSTTATEVIQWGQKKMMEEQHLESLMSRHPGLRDAHDSFEVMKALTQHMEKTV
jgi:hypothetical protein